jgi:hypothetical protein
LHLKGVGLMPTRAFATAREAEKPPAVDAVTNLTTDQKAATIQKWADWILKQRQAARTGRGETIRTRPPA